MKIMKLKIFTTRIIENLFHKVMMIFWLPPTLTRIIFRPIIFIQEFLTKFDTHNITNFWKFRLEGLQNVRSQNEFIKPPLSWYFWPTLLYQFFFEDVIFRPLFFSFRNSLPNSTHRILPIFGKFVWKVYKTSEVKMNLWNPP